MTGLYATFVMNKQVERKVGKAVEGKEGGTSLGIQETVKRFLNSLPLSFFSLIA